MKKYDLVIFGLTFFGTGVATSYKGDTLIIESKTKPGYEFIDSFHTGKDFEKPMQTEAGKAFSKYMKGENAGVPHIYSKTPHISKWIADANINTLLFTNIIDVTKSSDGYVITLFNSYGKTKISAKQIIDTRTDSYIEKKLGFITLGGTVGEVLGESVCTAECDGYSLWELDAQADYKDARSRIYSMFEEECSYSLVAVADEFYKKADVEGETSPEGYLKRYSTFYDNPIIAFDEGAKLGGELV